MSQPKGKRLPFSAACKTKPILNALIIKISNSPPRSQAVFILKLPAEAMAYAAQKLITPIHYKVNIIRRHVHFLTMALDIPSPAIPVMEVTDKLTPQKIASKLRQLWKVEAPVIKDLTKLIEDNGIVVNTFLFGTDRVDSRSILTDDKFPIIFFNNALLGDRQRFSLAYELGQLVMHTFSVVPIDRNVCALKYVTRI